MDYAMPTVLMKIHPTEPMHKRFGYIFPLEILIMIKIY